jgi:cytochrome P450
MKHPEDLATALIPYMIAIENPEYTKNGYFYLDMWPVSHQMMVVHHPDLLSQFCQDPSFPKHLQMPYEFGPFTHGVDLVTSNGRLWKTWRSIFSPGFSSANIKSYVPAMVEEFDVFRSNLEKLAAKGESFNADKYTMALTVDIIGHAVL